MKQWKHTAAEGAGHPPQLPPPAQSQPPLPRSPPGSSDLRLLDKHTDVLNPGEGNGRAIFCNKIRSKGQDQRTSCLLITTGMDNLWKIQVCEWMISARNHLNQHWTARDFSHFTSLVSDPHLQNVPSRFIPQTLPECLLCARLCAGHWGRGKGLRSPVTSCVGGTLSQ